MGAVCITFDDIPQVRYNERIITVPWALHKDHYVLADKVRRMGEAVAAVAAETEELAEQAARAVKVEYEPLPVVTDPHRGDAAGRGAALRHGHARRQGDPDREQHRLRARHRGRGRRSKAFAEADVVVEGDFQHPQDLPRADGAEDGGVPARGRTAASPSGPRRSRSTTCASSWAQIFDIPLSKIDVQPHPGRRHVRLEHPDELAHPHLRGAGAEGAAPGEADADPRRGHARPHQVSRADPAQARGQAGRHAAGRRAWR